MAAVVAIYHNLSHSITVSQGHRSAGEQRRNNVQAIQHGQHTALQSGLLPACCLRICSLQHRSAISALSAPSGVFTTPRPHVWACTILLQGTQITAISCTLQPTPIHTAGLPYLLCPLAWGSPISHQLRNL
mmetsp:Transcript_13767/g.29640  ORF Transcript_13767/g.29640 Transcript_13767/m.29640 type:complete len:131 (+) Transcript_13767:631-1023(+)